MLSVLFSARARGKADIKKTLHKNNIKLLEKETREEVIDMKILGRVKWKKKQQRKESTDSRGEMTHKKEGTAERQNLKTG